MVLVFLKKTCLTSSSASTVARIHQPTRAAGWVWQLCKPSWHGTTAALRFYLPLLVPTFIAHGLIAASYQWNNFLWPLIVINSVAKRPLTVGLAIFAQSYETGAQWSDVCSATFLVVAPLMLLFLVFQKRFIESFAYSGIK